jgi:hypothetical protein
MPALAEKRCAVRSNARTVIDQLVGLLHPRDGHKKILAVIEGYIDESGIEDGANVCVMCGLFGGKGQWKKFERDWGKALSDSDVPLDKFHALDLVGRNGKRRRFFYNWTDDQYDTLMRRLCKAVTSYKIYPVTHAIVIPDFNSFPEIQRRFFTGAEIRNGRLVSSGSPNRPYFVPFQKCIKRIASYAPVGGRAHFFFGLDRPFAKYAGSYYKNLQTSKTLVVEFRERLGQISFPLARETPELQAADLLTYLTALDVERRIASGDFTVEPKGYLREFWVRTRMKEDHSLINKASLTESIRRTHELSGNWDGHEEEEDLP